MVRCSPIPATCRAGHQRIALSSASSMQSWPGYSSSLDFVPDEYRTMQSPSLCCSDNTSNSSLLLSHRLRLGSHHQVPLPFFLHTICEVDRLTNFLIPNS